MSHQDQPNEDSTMQDWLEIGKIFNDPVQLREVLAKPLHKCSKIEQDVHHLASKTVVKQKQEDIVNQAIPLNTK